MMRLTSWILALVLLLGAASAAVVAVSRSHRPPPRDVVLVARGMAFYVEGTTIPNPTVTLRAGETVRLTLRNEAPGLLHDLAIPALGAALDPVSAGQSRTVTVEIPERATTVDYVCRPHATMMRGRFQVLADD
jgi:plastocyanin